MFESTAVEIHTFNYNTEYRLYILINKFYNLFLKKLNHLFSFLNIYITTIFYFENLWYKKIF